MTTVRESLTTLGINFDHVTKAVSSTHEVITGAADPVATANELIRMVARENAAMIGDEAQSRLVAKYAVESVAKDKPFDLEAAIKRATKMLQKAGNEFMKVSPVEQVYTSVKDQTEIKAVVEGIDVKVAVKADGSVKKGGKQVLALELFKKYVAEAGDNALDNQGFIALLVKELGMSKAGATTYAYNAKKAYKEATGQDVVVKLKKQKGVRTTQPYVKKGTPRGRRKKVLEPVAEAVAA